MTNRTAATPMAGGRRWIAWRIEPREENLIGCFRNWRAGSPADCRCSLAETGGNWGSNGDARSALSPGRLEIYAAVESGKVGELLLASESCTVDAGSATVTALEGVDPAASAALLRDLALAGGRKSDLSEKALAAIAFHATPAAPRAIHDVAREAADPDQRAHALFWLSQTKAPEAGRWIHEAIARDPDDDVREQAVFALSQLPDATDQLIAVIRSNEERSVRKQALFWLGQSEDPRAMEMIEKVLLR